MTHRANIVVDAIRERWGITGTLEELPKSPIWWINATNIATGKNWRFSRDAMGDWKHGRHYVPRFSIAEAVTASAAVPYVIGALTLDLPRSNWFKTNPSTKVRTEAQADVASRVRLWDGGAYENMGLEALYKPAKSSREYDILLASDASGELGPPVGSFLATLLRGHLAAPRLFDIAADQNRSLRSRMLIRDIRSGHVTGALLRMGNTTRYIHTQADRLLPNSEYGTYLSESDIDDAFAYPVDLDTIPTSAFDLLARHGFEVADATLTSYLPQYFSASRDFPF